MASTRASTIGACRPDPGSRTTFAHTSNATSARSWRSPTPAPSSASCAWPPPIRRRELNLSTLASDIGITQQTVKRWLAALEIGYLATTLPPHHASYRKRLRKRPRLHFLDTGLVCYLLDIRDAATLEHHPLRGAIFESFVVSELIKAFAAKRRDAPLYFWRDATGHEVDVLIDAGGRVVPLEVKSGQTVAADAVDGLLWWTSIPGNPNRGGVLVSGGTDRFEFKGVRVLPWFLR